MKAVRHVNRGTGLSGTSVSTFSSNFLSETKEVWQPYYERELTVEDAREIASNMVEFINILAVWEEELV